MPIHTDGEQKGNSSNGNNKNNSGNGTTGNGNGNKKGNRKSGGTDDAGYGNATNAEEHNSQNRSGILFPVAEEVSRTEDSSLARRAGYVLGNIAQMYYALSKKVEKCGDRIRKTSETNYGDG